MCQWRFQRRLQATLRFELPIPDLQPDGQANYFGMKGCHPCYSKSPYDIRTSEVCTTYNMENVIDETVCIIDYSWIHSDM